MNPSPEPSVPQTHPSDLAAQAPLAQVRGASPTVLSLLRRHPTRIWWATGACLVIAVVLVVLAVSNRGTVVTVSFVAGYGIKPGDAVRYLGVEVGRVESVELRPDLNGLSVKLALSEPAKGLAREGTRFWIERPRLSLSRMTGLDTVVGANYIGAVPGPSGGKKIAEFEGLETPPAISDAAPERIVVRFRDGRGLVPGDPLKHRGIVVGEVREVALGEDLEGVLVKVELVASAARLARAGSQFWIERPKFSLTEVRGIETVVGGRFLAVVPGPADGAALTVFEGLEQPPTMTERAEGGLEIVLFGSQRHGLEPASPVSFRGIQIGRVTSVGLSSDAVEVEARAYIGPEWRSLVRDNTRFWATSGLQMSMGLRGVRMDLESLNTLAAGGVALATPDPPGKRVATGHRFSLADKADEEWSDWQPRVSLGSELLPNNLPLPRPQRASLRWQERSMLGRKKDRQLDGWVLPLDDGRVVGPANLLTAVQDAIDDRSVLAVAGKELVVTKSKVKVAGRLAALRATEAKLKNAWTVSRLRPPAAPEDCFLVSDPQSPPLPIGAGRLTPADQAWDLDPAVSLDETWHGACAVSRQDGAVIGLVQVEKGAVQILLCTGDLAR